MGCADPDAYYNDHNDDAYYNDHKVRHLGGRLQKELGGAASKSQGGLRQHVLQAWVGRAWESVDCDCKDEYGQFSRPESNGRCLDLNITEIPVRWNNSAPTHRPWQESVHSISTHASRKQATAAALC